jgi:alpha-beta hydrolase superfamily lysophospholipase
MPDYDINTTQSSKTGIGTLKNYNRASTVLKKVQQALNTIQFKKYTILYRIYQNDNKSNVGILFLHGKISHSEYIKNIIDSNKGIKVFAFDYPGQGRSSGVRGHLDIYKNVPEITAFIAETIIKEHSVTNLYLAGESLGALICFYVYSKKLIRTINIKGLIFMPGVYSVKDFSNRFTLFLLFFLNIFLPRLSIRNRRPLTGYTSKKKKLTQLKNDKYLGLSNSVRYLYGIYKFFRYFRNHYTMLDIPVLLFQGEYDYYSTVKDFKNFYELVQQNPQNRIVHLENSRHWLLVGEETDIIKEELYNWIKKIDILESC